MKGASPTTATPVVIRRRPASVLIVVGVLILLGVSALAGGVALVFNVVGATPPADWLDQIPMIDDWLIPGLVLGIGFGLGSMVTAYGVLRRPRWPVLRFAERLSRHHWSWIATVVIGLGHVGWIGLELAYLPELSVLQIVYGTVAVALVLLPVHEPVRRYLAS